MKVLVAGGAGFIGSHLIYRLLENGEEVSVLDNFSSGRKENLDKLDVNIINADVTKLPENLPRFDKIYHLASLASPIFYQRQPIETALGNSLGTYNLLLKAKKDGSSFLFTSTSEVYGDPNEHPQTEEYWGNVNPNGVRSCYDESKRFAESIITDFGRIFGLNVHIVRIFNTYGPNMRDDDGRVIPNFIHQALKGENITIYGNGKQTRSFCYVSDTVDGIVRLMESDYHAPVNIGNPNELSIKETAEKIIELTNSKSSIVFEKMPEDDPKRRCPDITKAKKVLGWEPKIDFENGLLNTINYFK